MTVISKSVAINAPLAAVNAFMDQVDRIPDWFEGITKVEAEAGYPNQVGTKAEFTAKSAGLTVVSNFTLTKRDDSVREFEIEGMMSGTNKWSLREEGEITHLDLVVDYELSGGVLGKIMDRLLVERTYDSNSETSLQNLKRMIEA